MLPARPPLIDFVAGKRRASGNSCWRPWTPKPATWIRSILLSRLSTVAWFECLKPPPGPKNVDVIWLRGKESLQRLGRGQSGEALGAKTICLVKAPVSPSLLPSPQASSTNPARWKPSGIRSLLAAKPMRIRPSKKSLEEVEASRSWPTEKIEPGCYG